MMDGDRRKQMGEALARLHGLDPAIRQLRKTTQGVTLNLRAHWGLADQRTALNSKGLSSALKSLPRATSLAPWRLRATSVVAPISARWRPYRERNRPAMAADPP